MKIKIINDNKFYKVVNSETGELIEGVTNVDIHLGINDTDYAKLTFINPEIDINNVPVKEEQDTRSDSIKGFVFRGI